MDKPNGKRWAWLAPAVFVVACLAYALSQGLVIQEVATPWGGSVTFGERQSKPNKDPLASSGPSKSSGDAPTPGRDQPPPADTVQPDPAVGPWSATRGDVVVEVTKVENQGGHLRIDATVTNGTDDSLTVPLFKNVTAVDEGGRAYEADPFSGSWVETISSGQSLSGTIEFEGLYEVGPGVLDVSFARLYGSAAPSGGVVVTGIARP